MSLEFLYKNRSFENKGLFVFIYFPWLHFLTIRKYSDSFLFFEPMVDMVKSLTQWIKCFQNFDVGKYEYRKIVPMRTPFLQKKKKKKKAGPKNSNF